VTGLRRQSHLLTSFSYHIHAGDAARIAIAAQTADAYLRLASANEQLAILDTQLEVQRRLARTVALRFEAAKL